MERSSAPAVRVRGSGGLIWRCLYQLLPLVAMAVGGTWLALQLEASPWWGLLAALPLLRLAGTPPAASLAWDGSQWRCNEVVVNVEVMLDLGSWLLLRMMPQPAQAPNSSPPGWLALARSEAAAEWHAVRVALYSRAAQ